MGYKTVGDVEAELKAQRVNTHTQTNAHIPIGLLDISEDIRKLLFLAKCCILDIHDNYSKEEIGWHWQNLLDMYPVSLDDPPEKIIKYNDMQKKLYFFLKKRKGTWKT